MDTVNKKIAAVVACVGLLLIALAFTTSLITQTWFICLLFLWAFIFCSCSYRLTPLFKVRNQLTDFIQRDAQHLLLFSLSGFFDKKHGPHWVVIANIDTIVTEDDLLSVYCNNERQFSISLPAKKAVLDTFISRLLTPSEKQRITLK